MFFGAMEKEALALYTVSNLTTNTPKQIGDHVTVIQLSHYILERESSAASGECILKRGINKRGKKKKTDLCDDFRKL